MKAWNWKKSALLGVLILCVAVLCLLGIREAWLDELQQAALAELEDRAGEYDPQSIVLSGTNAGRARELANALGAELRITENGRFATLTLPEGTDIRDIYADKANRELLPELAVDYQARVSDLTEDEEEEAELLRRENHHERPRYPVSDPGFENQSWLDYMNLDDVWQSFRGDGVLVAVIDTGIDTDHPEFSGRISEYSYNATEDKVVRDHGLSIIEDEVGHGTAVAGVIGAAMDGSGTVGVAPGVELLVIKAECDENGNFLRTSDLVFGLYYAIERGAHVVNMSFGTNVNIFDDAAQLAWDSDIICVAAAGNKATTALTYPAADPRVIGVGALAGDSWELADYSNYGDNVDVVAPGTTYTTQMGGGYGTETGTSLASPAVAGSLALYLSNYAYQTPDQVWEVLYASCRDLGSLGEDWIYGYGAIDVSALTLEEKGTITFNMQTDELADLEQVFVRSHTLQAIPEPERLYAVFDGWYYDPQCTEEYQWYTDTFTSDLTLYAKWANEDDAVPYTYVTLDDGTVEIRSYTGRRRYITIPNEIDGKTVSAIGIQAFMNQDRLREVNLPAGLKTIGDMAFLGCTELTQIRIPDTVTSIGASAFQDNTRLNSVAFGSGSQLKTIGTYAFSGCASLERFEVPARLETMDGTALFGTTSLKAITVRSGNSWFAAKDGVLFNKSGATLVAYPAGKAGSYTVPDSVVTVGTCAFGYTQASEVDLNRVRTLESYAYAYSRLETVTIPDSVTEMGAYAFVGSGSLKQATLGKGLHSISPSAFELCTALEGVTIPNTIAQIGGNAFLSCRALTEVEFQENSTLTYIGTLAFSGTGLEQIQLPASLATIDSCAFSSNYALTRVTFEAGSVLTAIGNETFQNTPSLMEIILPGGLRSMGDYAFRSSGLASVTIPAGVETLGDGVFAACHDLTAIDVAVGNENYVSVDGVVYTADMTALTAYPAGKADAVFTIPDTVKTVSDGAVYGSWNLTSVTIPSSVEVVGEYAFYDCRNVTNYALFQGLREIGSYSFSRNSNLTRLSIPASVTQINRYAFAEDYSLYQVNIPDDTAMTRLGYAAFANTGITGFRVPANVATMAQGVFEGCENLYSITFAAGSKLDIISAYTFDGCTNLDEIIFEPGSALTTIAAHGFEGMSKLRYVDFGDAEITQIGNYAFRFCERLETLSLPDTLVDIGRFAFYGCKALDSLTLPTGLEHIGSFAFHGAEDLDLYFTSDFLPLYLDENWDDGLNSYHVGVSQVMTQGDWEYALLNSGNVSIIQYLGSNTTVDLTALDLGADIVGIGGHAFYGSPVTQVTLPDTLTTIQAYAFADSGLTGVTIPAAVEFIGRSAFENTPLTNLSFAPGSGLRVMEQDAFAGTKSLTAVTLPKSLTELGSRAFRESGVTTVTFESGIALTEIPAEAFAGSRLTAVTIPDSVTLIDDGAFRDCLDLTSVKLGAGEDLYIASNVFYNTGLTAVDIPANVGYIDEYAFVGLEKLESFTVSADNPWYTAKDGLLMSKDGRKLIAVPAGRTGSLTVPKTVEVIGFGAFENSKLSSVTLPADGNILTLGYRAFYGAQNLRQITIPVSVVSIDYYAFANCVNLEKVIFAEGNRLTGIYEGAFYGCSKLSSITLPDTIVEISDFAFYGCTALEHIPVSETSGVKGIYDYAFAYTGIRSLVIPESVIDIGEYAFMGIRAETITVPNANKKELVIGLGAFADCNQLVEITLPFIGASYEDPDITWAGYIFGAGGYEANATYTPQSLKTITITEGITFLDFAFYQLTNLEQIHVPHSVTQVNVHAFEETSAVFELTNKIYLTRETNQMESGYYWLSMGKGISGTLTIAGIDETENDFLFDFQGCDKLTEVTIDSIRELRENFFRECTGLTKVTLSDSVTTIGQSAFWGCNLMEVTLGRSVQTIGDSAFSGNSKLHIVYNNSSLTLTPGSGDHGAVAENAKLIVDRNGNKIYKDSDSGFTYVDTQDGFRFTYSRGAYTLIAYIGNEDTVVLPLQINEKSYSIFHMIGVKNLIIPDGFTQIDENAFADSLSLKSVLIPESVKNIGMSAFARCNNLESVYLHDGLTTISGSAFANCTSLRYIDMPDSVTSVAANAFGGCTSLKEVYLSDNLNSISQNLFQGCSSLETINIPDNVTSIGYRAFAGCSSLNHVTIPKSVEQIGDGAFTNCMSLHNFEIAAENALFSTENGVVYNANKTKLLFALPTAAGEITLPSTLTEIPNYAFQNCILITAVNIPNSITTISSHAFQGCTALEKVSLPDGLKVIYSSTFRNCTSLTQVTLPVELEEIHDYAFSGCSSLVQIEIPDGVRSIWGNVFENCISLTDIVLPDSITEMGGNLFYNCTNLKSAILPSNIKTIPGYLFARCQSLTQVEIPQSVTRIEFGAFMMCESLESVKIPEGVTAIGNNVFRGCQNLTEIIIPDSVTEMDEDTFWMCYGLERVVIGDGLTEIPNRAFESCEVLHEVTIGASVMSISDSAFNACPELRIVYNNSDLDITLGSEEHGEIALNAWTLVDKNGNTTYLPGHEGYSGPEYIVDENGFQFLEENGQYYLVGYEGTLDTVTLPTSIDGHSYIIRRFKGPHHVVIPSGVTAIGEDAFSCTAIESVFIGSGVEIGENAFEYCLNLSNVVIEDGVTIIGGSAFDACKALTSITIPDSVTTIGFGVFQTCENLKSVTLGSGLTSIGPYTFHNTPIYNDPDNWTNGMLIIDGHLIAVSEDVVFCDWPGQGTIAGMAFDSAYQMKQAVIGAYYSDWNWGSPTNIESVIVAESPTTFIAKYVGTPATLENVILKTGVEVSEQTFQYLTDISIFVEAEWADSGAAWDVSFPGWNNGNRVYYGDEWSTVCFYDVDGNLISREFVLNHQVVRQPYYAIPSDDRYDYTLVGWDIDGDGAADHIPATTSVDIHAYPVVERTDRKYTVTFYDKDGQTPIYVQHVAWGHQAALPQDPVKAGYTFLGWSGDVESLTVTSDVAIYSRWEHTGDGHAYGEGQYVAPTCTEPGGLRHTCSACGEWYLSTFEAPTGHSYGTWTVHGCEDEGYDLHTCSGCGHSYRDNYTEAQGHSYGDWTQSKAPTCSASGSQYRTCVHCGGKETEEIPALPHTGTGTVTHEPTCTESGQITYRCDSCGITTVEEFPVLPHDYERKEVPMSILELLIRYLLNMLWGHDGNVGYYFVCANCGQVQTVEDTGSIQSAETSSDCTHTEGEWVVAAEPAGDQPGILWRVCGLCGKALEARTYVDDCAHEWGPWEVTQEPTTQEPGQKQRTCGLCGRIQTEALPALDFKYGDVNGDGSVNVKDVVLLRQYLAGWNVDPDMNAADVNGDGFVNVKDVVLLRQYLAGWNVTLGPSE